MSDIRNWPVVVAIDGSESSQHALTWAADEAARRRTSLVIAHAGDVPQRKELTEATAETVLTEVCNFGRELLADAIATLAETHPEVVTTTVLREQRAWELIAELSLGASCVVVGRGDHSVLGRLILGSNAERIATHSYSPVVVVSAKVPPSSAPIVVGVSPTENGTRALHAACAEARLRDADVIALRCWADLNWSLAETDLSMSLTARQEIEQRILNDALAKARADHPGVRINGTLSAESPEIALSSIDGAGLLVVGCRHGVSSHFARLGPTTSWLLHHVAYPVMIVGEGKVVDAEATAETATHSVIATEPAIP